MRLLRELWLFGVIGVIGLAVDVAVLYALKSALGPFVARVVSFLAAATTTWGLNLKITFKRRTSSLAGLRELLSYLVLMLTGGAINYACYTWLVLTYEHVAQHLFIGVAAGSVAGMCFNFLFARFLLFSRPTD